MIILAAILCSFGNKKDEIKISKAALDICAGDIPDDVAMTLEITMNEMATLRRQADEQKDDVTGINQIWL